MSILIILLLNKAYLLLFVQIPRSKSFPTAHSHRPQQCHYYGNSLSSIELQIHTQLKKKTFYLCSPCMSKTTNMKSHAVNLISYTVFVVKLKTIHTRLEAHDSSIVVMDTATRVHWVPGCLTVQEALLLPSALHPGHPDGLGWFSNHSRAGLEPSHVIWQLSTKRAGVHILPVDVTDCAPLSVQVYLRSTRSLVVIANTESNTL